MSGFAIGLIGGIASGKSLAARYFKSIGADVIDADQIARALVQRGSPVLAAIQAHFGSQVLRKDGLLNRPRLRALIFSDREEKAWLEQLMHPLIRQQVKQRIAASKKSLCVVELSALKRREDYPELQKMIMVDVSPAVQLERLMLRNHLTKLQARRIIDTQVSRQALLGMADGVIVNAGSPADLFEKLKACKLVEY